MDAAFVPFRYARNFADGHGLVFNPGERVEGFLDPLWTMLWALATTVGVDPVSATAVVGPALMAVLVLGTAWLSIRAVGERAGLIAPLIIAAWPPVAVAARSGTDALFVSALLTIALVTRFAESESPGRCRSSGLWLVLLALSGIPGLVLALAVSGIGIRSALGRGCVRMATVLCAAAALTACRALYYGDIVPNAYLALPFGGAGRWTSGGNWLLGLLQNAPLLAGGALVGAVLSLWGRRPMRCMAWVCIALIAVSLPWMLGQGPRRSVVYQPLMLVLVPAAVLCAMGVAWAGGLLGRHRWIVLVLALGLFGAQDVRQTNASLRSDVAQRMARMRRGRALGRFFRIRFQQGERIGVHQPGVIPYYAQVPTLDLSGQTNREIAHSPWIDRKGRGRPVRSAMAHALSVRPAVIVHPRLRGGNSPKRLPPPRWYPAEFVEHYAATSFSARPKWGLTNKPGKHWLHFFVRRGVHMGHIESKWYPNNP
jgi:hypothetical protein